MIAIARSLRIAVALCVLAQPCVGFEIVDRTAEKVPAEALQTLNLLDKILKDPYSAKVKNLGVSSDRRFFCGEVNSKNGFGAYSGYQIFTINLSDQKIDLVDRLPKRHVAYKLAKLGFHYTGCLWIDYD